MLSADGKIAVLSTSEYLALGKIVDRASSRCLCGGPDPASRAMRDSGDPTPRNSQWGRCSFGHEQYTRVWAKDTVVQGTVSLYQERDALQKHGMTQAGVAVAKKVVPDWPLSCPKCARPSSAVLLFMGYDCKHGCFK